MSRDVRYMRRALDMAETGMGAGEMPIGAVVEVDGEIVSEAHTQEHSQRRLLVHADLLALEAADRVLGAERHRATLYVTLEPCVMCLGAAFTAKIGTVVYGLGSPSDGGAELFAWWDLNRAGEDLPSYGVPELRGGVLADESAELFERYADESPPGWARDWAAGLARSGRRSI